MASSLYQLNLKFSSLLAEVESLKKQLGTRRIHRYIVLDSKPSFNLPSMTETEEVVLLNPNEFSVRVECPLPVHNVFYTHPYITQLWIEVPGYSRFTFSRVGQLILASC